MSESPVTKKHLEFAYILALAMVLIAGWGLFNGKLTGGEWVTFSGIISAAFGVVEVLKAWTTRSPANTNLEKL